MAQIGIFIIFLLVTCERQIIFAEALKTFDGAQSPWVPPWRRGRNDDCSRHRRASFQVGAFTANGLLLLPGRFPIGGSSRLYARGAQGASHTPVSHIQRFLTHKINGVDFRREQTE